MTEAHQHLLAHPGSAFAHHELLGACTELHRWLATELGRVDEGNAAIGAAVRAAVWPVLRESDLLRRAYDKPRGLPGDYELMLRLYSGKPSGRGESGRLIDGWARRLAVTDAVRSRVGLVRRWIEDVFRDCGGRPPRVTSIGCGPAVELIDPESPLPVPIQAHLVDVDSGALAHVARHTHLLASGSSLTTTRMSVARLLAGGFDGEIGPQDLIYAVGLADYLTDAALARLVDWAAGRLDEGGVLLVGNVVEGADSPFLDHILDWPLVYRVESDLRALADAGRFTSVEVESDPTGLQLLGVFRG